ncbi:MAG: hypothetical protein IJS31_01655 [Oscillospiraceae bacterium]|nr:hypothetical protein [Oscillospiraceae bacterium]
MKNTKRRIFTLILALTLIFSIGVTADAACYSRGRTVNTRAALSTISRLRSCLQNPSSCNGWLGELLGSLAKQQAAQPTKPAEPEKSVETETPAQPEKPTETEKPAETPTQKPTQNETPSSGSNVVLTYEKEVVELVNEQRAKYGLAPLTISAELCAKARIKSQDMASNNYFSHTSPTYGSPFDMMKSLGIRYSAAGENIAMGYASPSAVVTAWMNSEGHRANILSANYTTIGVGYVSSGNYWTQWFIG